MKLYQTGSVLPHLHPRPRKLSVTPKVLSKIIACASLIQVVVVDRRCIRLLDIMAYKK